MNTPILFKLTRTMIGRKVGLVIPPSPFLLDERVFVSLGILRVASSLEKQGVEVGVLDLSGVDNYLDALTSYLESADIEWIGITCTTPQLPAAVKLSKKIRTIKPNLRIVLGGPHVTLTYSAVKVEEKHGIVNGRARKAANLLETYFDVLISGDGEFAVFECFKPDCAKMVDGDDMHGPFFMKNEQYEETEWPARHLVDLTSYHYHIEGFPATSLIAQLGCPFNCGFCGGRNSRSLRVIRNRSEWSIIEEVNWLHETYGYTGFMFYDDELNVSKTFVKLMNDIYNLQQKLGVEFRLRGFIKAELFTEEQAEAMYRAGFRWILSGFEAADSRILKNIDKMATLEDNTRVVEIAHKYGLKVKALMSVGHPGETKDSILSIRDWLIKMKVDDFDCTVITTYPGTPYYDLAIPHSSEKGVWTYTHKRTGDRLHAYELDHTVTADYYKGDPNGGYTAYVFTDNVSAKEIVELRDIVERDVRQALNIPFNPGGVSVKFEHSMGQGLTDAIYRESQLIK
jgi:anaerobic magnesium-protoporphyrin IX monomethyl ester cyclase